MTPDEIAGKLERLDHRVHDWHYSEPAWMTAMIRDNRHVLRDAAQLIRGDKKNQVTTKLAHALKLYLAARDLNGKDLAREWQCSESAVSRFLNGQSLPEPQTCFRIVAWMFDAERLPSGASRESHARLAAVAGQDVADAVERGMVQAKNGA